MGIRLQMEHIIKIKLKMKEGSFPYFKARGCGFRTFRPSIFKHSNVVFNFKIP
jgi:hypothetical protein